jgi:predicted AAA+ superfamily ATPase
MPLTKKGYRYRVIDRRIERLLRIFGAVCIEGPKWCGKTWSMLNHANSVCDLMDGNSRTLAEIDPATALEGEPPHAIDEWQEVAATWDAVRHAVDQSLGKGRFLLTGSVSPPLGEVRHSGVGRIETLRMHTMSLFESGLSTGEISLGAVLDGNDIKPGQSGVSLDALIDAACVGGWPGALGLDVADALELPRSYLKMVTESKTVVGKSVIRNKAAFRLLMASLARNNASMIANATLHDDVRSVTGEFAADTLYAYLGVLRGQFILDELPGWSPSIRSKARTLSSPKRLFADPSLAVAALGVGPDGLKRDLQTFGGIFEGLCLRDLAVYSDAHGAVLRHYRDNSKLEADAILEFPDASWAAFEIKLSPKSAGEGASGLLRLRNKVCGVGYPEPRALVVITSTGIARRREDGVYLIPIGMLRE